MRSALTPSLRLAALLLLPACADQSAGPAAPDTSTTPGESIQTAWGPAEPAFNLEAVLRSPDDGDGFGLVKFRQPNDEEFVVYLDAWVRDLAPNTAYALQRAVDLSPPNGQCDGESGWLTLGKGLVPQAIVTDQEGTGREQLFRAVPPTPGVGFDIQFRIVDDATKSVVVLQSECYQYTISQ
jgi:hypothetical protein